MALLTGYVRRPARREHRPHESARRRARRVTVEAPARLHFGILDLRGHRGRRFGGIGAAVPTPSVLLEATPDERLTAEGPDAGRAQEFARRYLDAAGIHGGAHLKVLRAIPAHAGLGSGTQLALAVARALAELYGQPSEPLTLARAGGPGRCAPRSGPGPSRWADSCWRAAGGPGPTPWRRCISRLPMPDGLALRHRHSGGPAPGFRGAAEADGLSAAARHPRSGRWSGSPTWS